MDIFAFQIKQYTGRVLIKNLIFSYRKKKKSNNNHTLSVKEHDTEDTLTYTSPIEQHDYTLFFCHFLNFFIRNIKLVL